jgi:enamine deaminase RidA (YjgF/YER057c/UK114 family)
MIKRFDPASAARPMSPYSQGVLVPAGMRTLFVSGQVGVSADGKTPPTVEEQLEIVWDNIEKIVTEGGMALSDIVSIRGYLLSKDAVPAYRKSYTARLAGTKPASTLVVIKELVAPQFLVEVEVVAMAP